MAAAVPEAAERVRVASHVDGDTLHVASTDDRPRVLPAGEDLTVRLLEIDTPEHGRSGRPEECYADEASEALRRMLPLGADAWAVPDRDLLDPYGRTLLYLWTDEGVLVNHAMVRRGYARAVLYEPNDAYIDRIREAERAARSEGRGMWGVCPLP